jgi:hypothetical protein
MSEIESKLLYLDIIDDGADPSSYLPSDTVGDLLTSAEVRDPVVGV